MMGHPFSDHFIPCLFNPPNTSTSFFPEKKFNSLIGNKLYSYLLLTMLDSLISLNALIAILTFTISGGPARDGHRVLRFVQFLFIYIVKRALSFLIFLTRIKAGSKQVEHLMCYPIPLTSLIYTQMSVSPGKGELNSELLLMYQSRWAGSFCRNIFSLVVC